MPAMLRPVYRSALADAIVACAAQRRRNPLREFFEALPAWDGKDHIGELSKYFIDKHEPITYADGSQRSVFHAFLLRWLCGVIAKIFGNPNAMRANTMLAPASLQGLGKSHFAWWISPTVEFYIEKQIAPDDKDCRMLRAKTAVWEVGELAATTKRRDVDELKGFITETVVSDRRPYAIFGIQKPSICSYIGSVNPDGSGFLADPTGNRRFAVVELEVIADDYAVEIDQRQVWSQALAIWRADPGAYAFSPEEVKVRDANAEAETEADVYADMIARVFNVDLANTEAAISSSEMMEKLRTYAGLSHGPERCGRGESWPVQCSRPGVSRGHALTVRPFTVAFP